MSEHLREMAELLRRGQRLDDLHQRACDLLGEIASGSARFHAVKHPLGFLYAPLLREPSFALRLHIWVAGTPRPELTTSPIHDHTWQLISYLVYGKLENWMVELADEPERPTHQLFEIRGSGSDDRLSPTGRLVTFHTTRVQRLKAGDRYTIPAGEFHYTEVPPDVDAATLLVAERKRTTPERALGPLHIPEHQMRREDCSPEELAEAAAAVVARMAAAR